MTKRTFGRFLARVERGRFPYRNSAEREQAVEFAKRDHPDLILMDVKIAEMDGIEALCAFKEIHKCKVFGFFSSRILVIPVRSSGNQSAPFEGNGCGGIF